MIKTYEKYGYNMPLKAKYKRVDDRVYFANDFKDGEIVTFFWNCSKPSACSEGYAFYIGDDLLSKLVNIKELEPIEDEINDWMNADSPLLKIVSKLNAVGLINPIDPDELIKILERVEDDKKGI